MKNINEFITESSDWRPSRINHKKAYNSFVKWYNQQSQFMKRKEIYDMLKIITNKIYYNDKLEEI